jgi:predicted amidohydrolase YtcJ
LPADLILRNASVITMSSERPRAKAVAVRDGRVWLVGGADVLERAGGIGTRVIDCQGGTLVPGFIDAHVHTFSLIRKLISIDLSPAAVRSIADIKSAVRRKAAETPPGQWITGTDYSEFHLQEKRHPTRWDVDEVAPDHPVVLSHRSLHGCVLNSRALELAGITRETPEPPGCRIERDLADGEPNGVLYEMLGHIREKVMPAWTEEDLRRGLARAQAQFLSQGITSVQDATVVNDHRRWQTFRRFIDSGLIRNRIYMMVGAEGMREFSEIGMKTGDGDDRLRLGGLKIVPSMAGGELYPPQPELNSIVREAHEGGFSVAIHAVRESTVESAILALEAAAEDAPGAFRDRLEHCGECPPRLVERLGRIRPVIATQPPFVYHGGDRYLATVEASQLPWLYRFRALLDAGLVVAASSDAPIVPSNPLQGIYGAVTRRTETGQELLPDEAITVERALAMYTTGAAYASGEEGIKGSIAPGMLADLALLSADPTAVSPEEIKDIRVRLTVVDGEVVWQG